MQKVTIELTIKEIQNLQISLSAAQLRLQEDVDRLSDHNTTGINTKKINAKKALIKELELLFDKLYDAENGI